MRFGDFLRTAVLLFLGAASACAAVTIAAAQADDNTTLLYVAFGWWLVAAALGLFLGRGAVAGIDHLVADARTSQSLPEVQPGRIIVNRLWALLLASVVAGGLAWLIPQVPAMAAGFFLLAALWWRRQPAAVTAIEERDGLRFYVERTSPFEPTKLIRTPGFRRNEPAPTDVQHTAR